jgi:hypothetical protein
LRLTGALFLLFPMLRGLGPRLSLGFLLCLQSGAAGFGLAVIQTLHGAMHPALLSPSRRMKRSHQRISFLILR